MADPKGLLVVPIGFRADGSLHALELDNSDRLKVLVDAITGSVTVAQDDPYALSAGIYGWINNGLQKQPIIPGYSSVVNEQVQLLNGVAGLNTLNGSVVPAGEIWIIENMYLLDVNNATVNNSLVVNSGGINTVIAVVAALPANTFFAYSGKITLAPGNKVYANLNGVTLNDDLYFAYHGVRVDIDQ